MIYLNLKQQNQLFCPAYSEILKCLHNADYNTVHSERMHCHSCGRCNERIIRRNRKRYTYTVSAPKTSETVGLLIPAIISAIANPASTSPPTVFKSTISPSISGFSSIAYKLRAERCSYFVVLFCGGNTICPSPEPIIFRQCILPLGFFVSTLPKSSIFRRSCSAILLSVSVSFITVHTSVLYLL